MPSERNDLREISGGNIGGRNEQAASLITYSQPARMLCVSYVVVRHRRVAAACAAVVLAVTLLCVRASRSHDGGLVWTERKKR